MSGSDRDDPNTPAITVAAIAAGLAVIVLVVLVAIIIWRRLRKHEKLVYTGKVFPYYLFTYLLHMAYVDTHQKFGLHFLM